VSNSRPVSLLAVVVGALILGATTSALREIDVGSTAAAFWRVALALPILILLAAWGNRRRPGTHPLPDSKHRGLLALAGAFFAGDLVFWHLALTQTTLGNATFLATLSSLWVPLTAFCLLKQPLSRHFIAGLVCALCGSGILVSAHVSWNTDTWIGDFYGLITGFFFTGYLLVIGRCRDTLTTTDTMLYSSGFCALFLLPFAIAANVVFSEPLIPVSLSGWLSVLALGLLAHLLGQGLVAFGVGPLNTSLAAVILCLEGVGAMAVGALFYSETRSWLDGFAVVLIVSGIGLAQYKKAA
jgi:drug/metabolite transporter (DMT)-like permease